MQTVVFYSYFGDLARSSLLRHTAFWLARQGKRVTAVDLDFEAPCLHYEFSVEERVKASVDVGAVPCLLKEMCVEAFPLLAIDIQVEKGNLTLVPAGQAPLGAYWRDLANLVDRVADSGWVAPLLDFKARLESELAPDILLLNAPPGVSRLGGLATTILADVVVCLTWQNAASLEGSHAVLAGLHNAPRLAEEQPPQLLLLFRDSGLSHPAELEKKISELGALPASSDQILFLDREPNGECHGRIRQPGSDGVDVWKKMDPAAFIWFALAGRNTDVEP